MCVSLFWTKLNENHRAVKEKHDFLLIESAISAYLKTNRSVSTDTLLFSVEIMTSFR
uniref:Uncharacterized protein n=1 Tax=Octopus bimaculoides TaxID=37653 RepID=A0A0L8FW74_OCTBM